jgi:hypothetical protein
MTPVSTRRRTWAATLAAAALLALGGCASLSSSGTPEEQVTSRAQKRWDALIQRDFKTALSYTQPAYRAIATPEDYRKRFGEAGQWKSAKIIKATCETERCTVRVGIAVTNMVPNFALNFPEITTSFDETWVRDEGSWWYYVQF